MVHVKIDQILEKNERNIAWLARKVDMTYSAIHALVNNQTQSISFDTLYKICKVLDCNIEDVLEIKD